MLTREIFTGDSYDTPSDRKRSLGSLLWFNSRWYFYLRNFLIFIRTGRCGAKGMLTAEKQVEFSGGNIRLVEDCGGKIHLRHLDILRKYSGKPLVIVSNHMSLLETAVLHAILRPHFDFTFVIKQSLLEVPFFRHIMLALRAIAVTRQNPREDFKAVLEQGRAVLAEGRSVVLFPQSTRSREFKPEEFNTLGVKLARSAKVPVLPMALKTDFLRTGKVLRDLGPLDVSQEVCFDFGEPMEITGTGREEQEKIVEFITSRLSAWNQGRF